MQSSINHDSGKPQLLLETFQNHLFSDPWLFNGKRREESAFQNSSISIHWGLKDKHRL